MTPADLERAAETLAYLTREVEGLALEAVRCAGRVERLCEAFDSLLPKLEQHLAFVEDLKRRRDAGEEWKPDGWTLDDDG